MVAWLECEGLGSLCAIAKEQGFNGAILLALHKVCTDPAAYKSDCNDLGIPAGGADDSEGQVGGSLWISTITNNNNNIFFFSHSNVC